MSFWANFKQKLGAVIAVVIGILALMFLTEKSEKEKAEETLLNKDTADKDKELDQQQTVLEQDNTKIQQQANQEKDQKLTQNETTDFLNKL